MSIQQRRQRERAHRHELIVQTARRLAESEGWEAVTVRRLAEQIEYSQPVLYSHFAGKDAIVAAVAVQGFAELGAAMADRRAEATTPEDALEAVARAYVDFAAAHPELYDAMFTRTTELAFAQPDTPSPLAAAFEQLQETVGPLAGPRDRDLLAEITWSALHGLITLARDGRLRAKQQEQRLAILLEQLRTAPGRAA